MVLSLEEFKQFTPKQNTYALFGYPLGHSMSPELHKALFSASLQNADYIAVEIPPENLSEAISIAKEKLHGFNLTIPHKKNVIPLLDSVDEHALALNSVNTVVVENGKISGYNTDILGFSHSLKQDNIILSGKTALLLGYGGVSAVMGYQCLAEGANLIVSGRNDCKGKALVENLKFSFPNANISFFEEQNIPQNVSIIINGTPVGMYPNENESPIQKLPKETEYIFDAIYNPPLTALLKLADNKNIKTRDGLFMLVLQAAFAQTIWLKTQFTQPDLSSILRKLYGQLAVKRLHDVYDKSNIVLTGFMGSGKTTIGIRLAKIMGLSFVDADLILEQQEKRSISEIFQKFGENHFRNLETKYIEKLSLGKNQVISTGGGAVLRDENLSLLKNDGLIVHLDTPIEKIIKNLGHDNNRPLLAGDKFKEINDLYYKRKPIYHKTADVSVCSTKISEIIDKILKSI